MKFIYLTIAAYLFAWGNFILSQPDTILVGYPIEGNENTVITEATVLSSNNIIFTQADYNNNYRIYIVDTKGNVVRETQFQKIKDFNVFSVNHITETNSSYFFIANATKNSKQYLISCSADSSLEEIYLIDSLSLDDDTWLSFENMKPGSHNIFLESFGIVRKLSSTAVLLDYFYLRLTQNYKFEKFVKFKTKHAPNYVFDFYWVESVKRYVFSCFNSSTILVDENINFVYEGPVRVNYVDDGIPTTSILKMYNYVENINNLVLCYGKEPWDRPYNAAFVWLEIRPDTILLSSAIPLSKPPLGVQYESAMRKDKNGDFIISGANGLPLISGLENTLKVVKYTPDYQKIWEFSYSDNKGFTIYDMEIDHNNDIILVGKAWNMYGDSLIRGFLMKIYANGTLSSYEEAPGPTGDKQLIRITPNPIVSSFCLRTEEPVRLLRFWDVGGRMVWEGLMDRLPYCGALPAGLPPGFYAAEVWFKNGRRAVEKVVVSGQE